MQDLARRLFAFEVKLTDSSDPSSNVTAHVCEKIRTPLLQIAGAAGYSSLLSRALTLARIVEPALQIVQVRADGTLEGFDGIEKIRLSSTKSAEHPGVVLVGHLLSLLVTFIGASIATSLLGDAWPNESFSIAEQKVEEKT